MKFAAISQYFKLSVIRDQQGITTVEYAIMLVLVAAAVLAGGSTLPASITSTMSSLATAL
jgi:Flp pilus assembly pilin Flp